MSDASSETNVDLINRYDVSTQKETTYENILEYFESYIKPYTPFKDEPAYKAIVSFIIKYYVDLIYNVQPEIFKDLFEKQTIRSDVVDLLLISIGLPENVVRSITTISKYIILKSFSDFERYKGTVKFIRSIGGAFNDVISYYELYIDYDKSFINPVAEFLVVVDKSNIRPGSYFLISSTETSYYIWFNYNGTSEEPSIEGRTGIEIPYDDDSSSSDITQKIISELNMTDEFYVNINGTDMLQIQASEHGPVIDDASCGTTSLDVRTITEGKIPGAWILRPRPIYIHPKTKQLKEVFSYQAAYNKIPTLLVPESQLEELKQNDQIVLPTKSNIILMDYTQSIDASYFNTLIFTILMQEIGDQEFPVYLTGSDGTTTITYNTAIFLWYYLLAKYYNVTLEGVSLAVHIVMGTNKVTDYTIESITEIQNAYDNIKTRKDLIDFYNEYITDRFTRIYEAEKPTVHGMSETLRKIDAEFWEYIEHRLADAENQEQDIRFLLDEIYASMVLSFDQYADRPIIHKYIPVLLQFITQVTTNIKVTDSYKIVYNLKPFHTELLDLAHNKIEINNKFNALLFDGKQSTIFNLALADLLHMSDEAIFSFVPKKDGDSLSLIDAPIVNCRWRYSLDTMSKDKIFWSFLSTAASALTMVDQAGFVFKPEENETVISFIDSVLSKIENKHDEGLLVHDDPKQRILESISSVLPMTGKMDFLFNNCNEKKDELNLRDPKEPDISVDMHTNHAVRSQAISNVLKTFSDTPYMSDEKSFSYKLKDTALNINSKHLEKFSHLQNSRITLNDEFSIN